MTELKPCPFCGGHAELRIYRENVNFVQCRECLSMTTDYPKSEGAVNAWNNRYNLYPLLKHTAKYYLKRLVG